VPACMLVGDLETTVVILDEPPAVVPRVWPVVLIRGEHVHRVRGEEWPLRSLRLHQLHARSAYMQRGAPALRTHSGGCARDRG
jgi:hypothetical protein